MGQRLGKALHNHTTAHVRQWLWKLSKLWHDQSDWTDIAAAAEHYWSSRGAGGVWWPDNKDFFIYLYILLVVIYVQNVKDWSSNYTKHTLMLLYSVLDEPNRTFCERNLKPEMLGLLWRAGFTVFFPPPFSLFIHINQAGTRCQGINIQCCWIFFFFFFT